MRRREVLKLAALSPVLMGAVTQGCAAQGVVLMGPFVARPSRTSMSIWCEGEHASVSSALLVPSEGGETIARPFEAMDDGLYLATFDDLTPDTAYEYGFEDAIGTPYQGTFRTLPAADGVLSMTVGADIHPQSAPYTAFAAVRARAPHLFLALGDQVYADLSGPVGATEADHRALYRRTWDDESLRDCWANVPTLLVWDDHEVWNDYDGSFGADRIVAARGAYERYQRSRNGADTPWIVTDLGPASMFVMDTRSFRSPNAQTDGPEKTMLGAEQLAALLDFIATSEAPLCLLASPTPFHPHADTGIDAWAHGFAYERGVILQAIVDRGASRFVLVTGDQHWPAVVRNALPGGGTLLELQCTPVAAFARTPPSSPSPDFLYVGDGSPGFGALEISATAPRLRFAWVKANGEDAFTLDVP